MSELKLYKTTIITLNDNDVEIRAYKIGDDSPIVAQLVELQLDMESLSDESDTMDYVNIRLKMEPVAFQLAQRGLKRALNPDAGDAVPEELDNLPNFEIDPDDALQVAWSMINLGTPGVGKGKPAPKEETKKKKKKSSTRKSS